MTTYVLDGRMMQDHYWGIGRYVFQLARNLGEVAPDDCFRVLYNPRARNTRFDLSIFENRPNIELVVAPARAFSVAEQRLAYDRALAENTALFHAPYYAFPYSFPRPRVVTLEDVTPLAIPDEMPSAAKRLVYRGLNRLAASRARAIITLSEASRSDLENYLGIPRAKISIIPLATFGELASPSPDEIAHVRESLNLPSRYLLYLGVNKPHKNLVRLIQAFARIVTDIVLVVAGHWDARYGEPMQLVERLRLTDRVLFRHDIVEADLAPLIAGATAFVFPSLHEGFGLPPLEAMRLGTPVISSDASALPEVVGEAAVLFDPLDVNAIAEALVRVLDDPNLRATLHDKGLAQAGTFSWARTARATLDVYRTMLHENPSSL